MTGQSGGMRAMRTATTMLATAVVLGAALFIGDGLAHQRDPVRDWDPAVVEPTSTTGQDVLPGARLRPRSERSDPSAPHSGAAQVPAQPPVRAGVDDPDDEPDGADDDPDSEPDEVDGLDDSDED